MVEFKPALGWVFRDYLKEYSHWAYGDLDVFFGDLTKGWLEPSEMRDYDIVTYRYIRCAFSCILVRSCPLLCLSCALLCILAQFLCILAQFLCVPVQFLCVLVQFLCFVV